ncbi:helix-turn-helix domain-containing protein [Paenibacillus tengchongensis]|uniref:helix-turn-helix domain-containing protein n=1 Tax=Paenibacillus tengchongensis TaxID=2608684 RepID=UPI00124E4C1E|nr:helix-turn-helix domain-containing protein [Paenibacillus tengchongensis]
MEIPIKEMLLNNISFAYNEAMEMIIAMGMIACEEQMEAIAEDYKITLDPQASAYHAQARASLSPHAYRELLFFFGYNFLHKAMDNAFYYYICRHQAPLSVESWIDLLAEEPAERAVAEMVWGVYYDKFDELLDGNDWEAVKGDLNKLSLLVAKVQPHTEVAGAQAPLLECLAYPEETKGRYLQLLRVFYKDAFSHWKEPLRQTSEAAVNHYRKLFLANPERFIREINKNEPTLYEFPTTFHISFMSQVNNHFLKAYTEDGPVGWVLFGIHNERIYGPVAEREKTELFLKTFSDKRRLDFLLLLRSRPHYGQEIAAALGITPAAVNYHANFLFFLDLIELKRQDHRLYYHLHTGRLRELLALTAKVMLEEQEEYL